MHTCEAASKNKRSEARKRRNRQHAKNSRERRRQRLAWLETRLSVLEEDKAELLRQEAALVAENAGLARAECAECAGVGDAVDWQWDSVEHACEQIGSCDGMCFLVV